MPKLDTLGMSTIVKVAATWAEAAVADTEVCGLHAFLLACILYLTNDGMHAFFFYWKALAGSYSLFHQ